MTIINEDLVYLKNAYFFTKQGANYSFFSNKVHMQAPSVKSFNGANPHL